MMNTLQLAVTVMGLLAATCIVANAQGTAGKTVLGFKYDVDVTSYYGLSLDCNDIKKAIAAKQWTVANTIYTAGKNSITSTGTKRSLKTIGNAVRTGEQFFKTYGAGYAEKAVIGAAALTAAVGSEKAEIGCQLIMLGYVAHEMDVAKNVLTTAPAVAKVEINDAFGIWVGSPSSAVSLQKHVAQVEKWVPCAPKLVTRMVTTFRNMRTFGTAKNQKAFNTEYNTFFKLNVALYLRTIVYGTGRKTASWQKYSLASLNLIRPLLADKANASKLATLLASSKIATPAQVRTLIQTIAKAQGVTNADAGVC